MAFQRAAGIHYPNIHHRIQWANLDQNYKNRLLNFGKTQKKNRKKRTPRR